MFSYPGELVGSGVPLEVLAELPDVLLAEAGRVRAARRRRQQPRLGVNSIDILNLGRETGLETRPNSVLGHSKFGHV